MALSAALGVLASIASASASTITSYEDPAAFTAAIGTPFTLETWDALPLGTHITSQVPGVSITSPNESLRNFVPIQVMASRGALTPPNVLAGGNIRSSGTPPEVLQFDLSVAARAFAFYVTDHDPAATDVVAQVVLRDGTSSTIAIHNPHTGSDGPIFHGFTSVSPITRVSLTAGFKKTGKGGYESFSIDNLVLGMFCSGDGVDPVCAGAPSTEGGVVVIHGTGTDAGACDSGIAGVSLATGATNVVLSVDPAFAPGDPSAEFTVQPADTAQSGSAIVVVTDRSGNTCTLPVSFRSVPPGPTNGQVLCSGPGFLFQATNGNSTPAGPSGCSAALPSDDDPPYPPGYEPSPADDPFPCRILTIDSPIAGLTQMTYKKDGTYDPRLRLLFTRSEDGGVTFPPFRDVTSSVEPILNIDPDPTRVKGSAQWSPVKVTCALLQVVADCAGIDPSLDADQDGFPLCPAASSGLLADCNDQIGTIHPGAAETCNGMDDDCDGVIDEDDPGGGQPCTVPDRLGACAAGRTTCVDGALVCRQTVFASTEVCDGVDNDCDGAVDEGLGSTTCGTGACAVTVPNCVGGAARACVPGAPATEICDGLDNDCDGAVDEGLGTLTCGTGPCTRTVPACVAGAPGTCVPGSPGIEVCDGIDNDCDGAVDEAWTFGGYLQPVEADGSGVYHRRQTIPFKFQLKDCLGDYVPGAGATIAVFFYADGVAGTKVKDLSSSGQANTDNIYRYDPAGHQYIYNLGTTQLNVNTTYLVRTTLGDGTTHDVLISIIR